MNDTNNKAGMLIEAPMKAAVAEARKVILEILRAKVAEDTKQIALQTLAALCQNRVEVSHCNFTVPS